MVKLWVRHGSDDNFMSLEVICVPFICNPLSRQNISEATKFYPSLTTLCLADTDSGSSEFEVNVLVGLDYYHRFFTGEIIKTKDGPTANRSILGWVLSGPICSSQSVSSNNVCFSHVMRSSVESPVDDSLRKDLERFWSVESVTNSEECVMHDFEKDIRFNGERYVTKLPFRPDHGKLSDNLSICEAILKNLKRRVEKTSMVEDYDAVFKVEDYDAVFKGYEKDNIIEKVPINGFEKDFVHYLPHRGVVREDKETTKLRIVFDASCASEGAPSLNDCLYPGSNLISKIFDILLRFRLRPIAILSDIKQAFLNIEVDHEHQDFLRFLWYQDVFDRNSEIVV